MIIILTGRRPWALTEIAHMIWCGNIRAQGRLFHACVYISHRRPFLYATIRPIEKDRLRGLAFDLDLDSEQQDSLLSEVRLILREKVRTVPS